MPGRRLNIPRIKRIVMFLSGITLGIWSAVTGLSAQAATAPYLSFMLGYAPPKASARAFVFAMWSALTAAAAWVAFSGRNPEPGTCIIIAVGAVLGAIIAARIALPTSSLPIRVGRTLITLGLLYVVVEGVRARFGGPLVIEVQWLRSPVGWILSGAVCGTMARLLALPIGVFLVPTVVYAGGLTPDAAIVLSLSVSLLAGMLPAIGYILRTERDELLGPSLTAGGIIGGAIGGFGLARLASPSSTWPLAAFGVTAMLLSSWLAYRGSD